MVLDLRMIAVQNGFFVWEPYGLGQNIFALAMFGLVCVILLTIIESKIFPKFFASVQWKNDWETGMGRMNDGRDDIQY